MEKKELRLAVDAPLPRRLPLTLIFALIMQAATAVWWASAKERDVFFLQQRVMDLESSSSRANAAQEQLLERLARIEERMAAQINLLDRIEKQLRTPHF